jgi:hypothetical protein
MCVLCIKIDICAFGRVQEYRTAKTGLFEKRKSGTEGRRRIRKREGGIGQRSCCLFSARQKQEKSHPQTLKEHLPPHEERLAAH